MFPVDVPFIHMMLDGDFSWNRETSYDAWCFKHQTWGEIHQQTSWRSSNSRFAHPPQDNTHRYKVVPPSDVCWFMLPPWKLVRSIYYIKPKSCWSTRLTNRTISNTSSTTLYATDFAKQFWLFQSHQPKKWRLLHGPAQMPKAEPLSNCLWWFHYLHQTQSAIGRGPDDPLPLPHVVELIHPPFCADPYWPQLQWASGLFPLSHWRRQMQRCIARVCCGLIPVGSVVHQEAGYLQLTVGNCKVQWRRTTGSCGLIFVNPNVKEKAKNV